MDLISIERRYRNIKRIIISIFIIMVFVYAFLAIEHVYASARKERFCRENEAIISKIIQEQEEAKKQEEEQKK